MSAELSAPEYIEDDVTGQLPPALREWLVLERFHLHKAHLFQNPARDPQFDTRYFPQHCRAFLLPCYWVPRKHLYVHGANESAEHWHFETEAGTERVLFPVHPSASAEFRAFLRAVDARDAMEHGVRFWAIPTSSTRTLLVWPDGAGQRAVFVKTSLHSPIFGDRRVTRTKVARAIGNCQLVRQAHAQLPAELRVMPEVLGFSARTAPGSGALVRPVPPELIDGRVRAVPLFSLLGGEDQGRVPLLLELLERTDTPPVEYIDERLCKTFAPLWVELALNYGLILEAHGQDLLLSLSPSGVPTGDFYYRDLEGLQVDWALWRRRMGSIPTLPNAWAWHETHASWGYRYTDFVWHKWRISLFGHLRLVLSEVEASLRDWHDRGRVRGPKCRDGELTMLFSSHLFAAIERRFNVSMGAPYDILPALNRFILALFRLRQGILQSTGARESNTNK
jgi:hypothetical protein